MTIDKILSSLYDDCKNVRGTYPYSVELSTDLWNEYMLPTTPTVSTTPGVMVYPNHFMSPGFCMIKWGNDVSDTTVLNTFGYTGNSICLPKGAPSVYGSENKVDTGHYCDYKKYVGFTEVYEYCTICDSKKF